MNAFVRFLPLAALLLASPVVAQTGAQFKETQHARELREAEAKLAEASQRVAELSMRNFPERWLSDSEIIMVDLMPAGRPWMGVTFATEKPEMGPVEGVEIVGVTPGSAAAEAGLRSGDVITSVNAEPLAAAKRYVANDRLLTFMQGVEEGDKLDIEYLRDGNVGRLTVEPRVADSSVFVSSGLGGAAWEDWEEGIARIPDELRHAWRSRSYRQGGSLADMELVELSEGLGKYFGTDQGVLVVSAPASGALELKDGDVIQRIDGREPTSLNHALRILGSYQPGEALELSIMRDRRRRKLTVTIPDDRTSFVPASSLVVPIPVPVVAPIVPAPIVPSVPPVPVLPYPA